jgi:hypothetical protein
MSISAPMKQKIFPKEIIRFSIESHYVRFSRYSITIYIILLGIIISSLSALPFLKVDVTSQSRGIIRSQAEPTTVQTPVTGQVKKITIQLITEQTAKKVIGGFSLNNASLLFYESGRI